jgi:regulator of replication initiation timing
MDRIDKLNAELTAARAEIERLNFSLKQASSIYDAVTEQRDRLAEALKEEMKWAKEQSHLCDKESLERQQKNDDLGSRYYDGLSVAFYQSMRRMSYRLIPLQSLTTNEQCPSTQP